MRLKNHVLLTATILRLRIRIRIRIFVFGYKSKKRWGYSCRPYQFPHIRIRKQRPEKWPTEPFYPDADDIGQDQEINTILLEEFLHSCQTFLHPYSIKNDLQYTLMIEVFIICLISEISIISLIIRNP